MVSDVPVDTLDPAQDSGRCVNSLEAHPLEIEDGCEDGLDGYEVGEQDLRNVVVGVDEGLELFVCPPRWNIV